MPKREQQAGAGQETTPLRKKIDASTERLGIKQVRGEGSQEGLELATVTSPTGETKDVWLPSADLAKKQEAADAQFDKVLSAVTAGGNGDKQMIGELLRANKEALLKLGAKEADPVGSLYRVMEDAVDALEAYDKEVERIIAESGYTGIVEDGLRNELMKEKDGIFSSAFEHVSTRHGVRSFEQAVHAKLLAASAKHLNIFKETLQLETDSDELELQPIEDLLEEVSPMESVEHTPEQQHIEARYINAIQRTNELHTLAVSATKRLKKLQANGDTQSDAYSAAVQEDDQYHAALEASKNMMRRIEKEMEQAGLDPSAPEFATKAAREAYAEELRTLNEQNRKIQEGNIRERGRVENAPDLPEGAEEDWEEETSLRNTLIPRTGSSGPTLVPLPTPAKPKTTPRIKSKPSGRFGRALRKVALPLLAMLGIQSGMSERSPSDLPTPQREVAALSVSESENVPEGTVEGVPEEMEAVYIAPSKEDVDVKRMIRKVGDPQNIEDALKVLSVYPSTTEFKKMEAQEKIAATQAALEDFKTIREALSGNALKKIKTQEVRLDLEKAQANWESLATFKEALKNYPDR
jgi:hypothetical protein